MFYTSFKGSQQVAKSSVVHDNVQLLTLVKGAFCLFFCSVYFF